jgi:hypothetical protein
MVLVFALAAAATAAIKAFNRLPAPSRAALVFGITQGTSVLIALTTAVQWVMQGLQGLTRLSSPPLPGFSGSTVQVGRPASERVAA